MLTTGAAGDSPQNTTLNHDSDAVTSGLDGHRRQSHVVYRHVTTPLRTLFGLYRDTAAFFLAWSESLSLSLSLILRDGHHKQCLLGT
jgi:hypothetical protein